MEEGDILAEIETDKATMEFESFYSGTLLHIGIQEGESSPIDAVLAVIGPAGTDVNAVLGAAEGTTKEKGDVQAPNEESKKEETAVIQQETGAVATADGLRIFASPLAKRIAKEKGIDLKDVKGTGDNGRIVKKDVETYVPSRKGVEVTDAAPAQKATEAVAPLVLPVGEESSEEVKNSQMRKTIAKRLSESKFTAPHYLFDH